MVLYQKLVSKSTQCEIEFCVFQYAVTKNGREEEGLRNFNPEEQTNKKGGSIFVSTNFQQCNVIKSLHNNCKSGFLSHDFPLECGDPTNAHCMRISIPNGDLLTMVVRDEKGFFQLQPTFIPLLIVILELFFLPLTLPSLRNPLSLRKKSKPYQRLVSSSDVKKPHFIAAIKIQFLPERSLLNFRKFFFIFENVTLFDKIYTEIVFKGVKVEKNIVVCV